MDELEGSINNSDRKENKEKKEKISDLIKAEHEHDREEFKSAKEGAKRDVNEFKKHKLTFKELLKITFSIEEDAASPEEVRNRILSGGQVYGTNATLLMFAIIIASVGLNVNSTAVIIGAMLISPLMGTILSLAYGTVTREADVIRRSAMGFVTQIVISIGTSTIYFLLSPQKEVTTELLARTSPSFFDVIIATAGGFAGIIGQTRKDKSNTVIPGVAIATAIMPPLCTCGFAISHGYWYMLFKAFYLFVINSYFIYTSAEIILTAMKMPKSRELTVEEQRINTHKKIRNTIIILIPCIFIALGIYAGQ